MIKFIGGTKLGYLEHNVEEHNKAKKLAEQIEKSKDDKKKREKFEDLYVMIYAHHKAEEEVVFPTVMEGLSKDSDKDVVREMIEEHSLASYQFSTVNQTLLENDTWNAKFSTLMEVVEHHMEEEEGEFAKLAKKVLDDEKSEELLKQFEDSMDKYEQEIKKKLNNNTRGKK